MAAVFFVFFLLIFPLQKEIEQYAVVTPARSTEFCMFLLYFFFKKK